MKVINYAEETGYTSFSGREMGFSHIKEFGILRLNRGSYAFLPNSSEETGIVVLSGTAQVTIGAESYPLGKRPNVFSGLPEGAYIPPGLPLRVETEGELELAVCKALSEAKTESHVVRNENVRVNAVGRDNWSREVRLIIPPGSYSDNLILGETLNPSGNWSGTPPHKHEVDNVPNESLHEELYFFKTALPQGWGGIRIYSPQGRDDLLMVQNNKIVPIPSGYHQVFSCPGSDLYYLFFLAGKGNKLHGRVDENFKFLQGVTK